MEQKRMYVAFGNQKGGVGKSGVTTMFASYLHYTKGRNVALIDCDYPQHSIAKLRERDMESVSTNNAYKMQFVRQMQQLGKKAYPVLTAEPQTAIAEAGKLSANSLDLILFDLPGTVLSRGVLDVVLKLDYLFCPLVADRMVMQSSLAFGATIKEYKAKHPEIPLRGVYMFWNRVNRSESKDLYQHYRRIISDLGLNMLETELPETTRFKKEMSASGRAFLRSTLLPPDKNLMKGSNFENLADEVCNIINI